MGRTRTRPLPSGRIEPRQALTFGVTLGAASFALLATTVNLLSASLALLALLFYVFVYTMWLKRSSMQNIVIGGAAGAIPPLVGWAAVTGSLNITAVFLFAVVFYWTPPHFWALSLLIKSDYARAGVPMMPVVQGDRQTRYQIVLYTIVLCLVTVLPLLTGSFGAVYLGGAARARRDPPDRRDRRRPAPDGALGTPALLPFNDLPGPALRGHGDRPGHRALRRTRR